MTMYCRGIRGATTCDENTRESILEATRELLQRIIAANGLQAEDIASAIFSTTHDLTAALPGRGGFVIASDAHMTSGAETPNSCRPFLITCRVARLRLRRASRSASSGTNTRCSL